MPKLTKLKTSDLIIIGIMGLAIVGIGYLVYHNAGKIAQVSAERKAKEAELDQIRTKVENFGKLRQEVTANEDKMQQIATYIPQQEGQSDFVTELSGLILGSGVKFKSCKAGGAPAAFPNLPDYQVYKWDLTFTAVYPQLLKFLEALPVEERSTLVSKINISSGEADGGTESNTSYILNVQLTLDLISKTGAQPGQLVAGNAPKKVSQ